MSAYGFKIVQTLIVDIEPDVHVKKAMNEINAGNISILFASPCKNLLSICENQLTDQFGLLLFQ